MLEPDALKNYNESVAAMGVPDSVIMRGQKDQAVSEHVRAQHQPVLFAVRAGLDTTSCDKFCLPSLRLVLQGSRTVVAAPIADVKVA